MADAGVSVAELVDLSRSREGRLPFEIGAFVALEASERLLLKGPAVVSPADVLIADDGSVSVRSTPHSASDAEAARSVVDVLAHLLVASGTGVPPVLLSLVEQGPADGRWDLGRLRDELEASLVPLNRSAARRVLSRLLRDAKRPTRARTGRPPPSIGDVDADLDALLDGGPVSPEPPTMKLPALDEQGNPIVSFADVIARKSVAPPPALDLDEPGHDPSTARGRRSSNPPASVSSRPPAPRSSHPPAPVENEPERPLSNAPDLDGFDDLDRPRKSKAPLVVLGLLIIIAAAVVGVWQLRPEAFARMFGDEGPRIVEPEPQPEPEPAPVIRAGNLEITGPEGAQIFLFVGRGPAIAENLPVGVAHELVAVADGREPTRAVVPADAAWSETDDGSLYELAMQTGEDEMAFERLDLGETRLTRDGMGTPSGALGRVRVLTTPPGARVFLLIGFGRAAIEDLPVDEPLELLVYAPEMRPERVFVGPSDWVEQDDGTFRAAIETQLSER